MNVKVAWKTQVIDSCTAADFYYKTNKTDRTSIWLELNVIGMDKVRVCIICVDYSPNAVTLFSGRN